MTYRFKLQEPIGEGVRRIGLEQIEIAEAKLASKDDISASIHDARRCLKRMRALLRLIRPGLEERVYRREAERLAGIGNLLSGARDLDVMQLTLQKLESRFDTLPAGAAERLGKLVDRSKGRSRRAGADGRRQALLRLARRKGSWPRKAIAHSRSTISSRGLGPPTARRARPSDTPTASRATRPSTPGASACNCTGGTCAALARLARGVVRARRRGQGALPAAGGGSRPCDPPRRRRANAATSILEPRTWQALTALCSPARRSSGRRQAARREAFRGTRAQSRGARRRSTGRRPSAWRPWRRPTSRLRASRAARKAGERALRALRVRSREPPSGCFAPARASVPPAPSRASRTPPRTRTTP